MDIALKFGILVLLTCSNYTCGEKLNRLESLIATLSNKFGDFVAAVDKITHMLNRMEEKITLNELIAKCAENIDARNEIGATKIWQQIIKNHNQVQSILNQIIVDSYGGKRENILPLIRFITRANKCSGFETLLKEMSDYSHLYNGGEVFSLANSILNNNCNHTIFEKLPPTVQLVMTQNVTLQSTYSKGFLYRKWNVRDSDVENQIATRKSPNATDHWRFVPVNDYAESFLFKNRDSNLVASSSRRLYFAAPSPTHFNLEMNRNGEISIGVVLETPQGGRKLYRLYVQKQKIWNDIHELNLWTISPKDDYGKLIYWIVRE